MKKGYKVADVKREKRIGVAAENLQELIEKSCKKLGFNARCAALYVAEDGTQVADDDYLDTLPPQTLFILLKDKEQMVTDFDHYYSLIRSSKKEYIDTGLAAKEFLTTNIKEKFKVFQKYIAAADEAHTMLSERAQDPKWFEGLEPSEKTKEQSMCKRVKDRMRGYFYKTKSALQASDLYIHSKNSRGKKIVDQFLADLRKLLETNKYNEDYFNRKAEKNRLCNERGLFECGGLYNNTSCAYKDDHVINPYRSREERIIFQTWNLDHKIELSRSIIPQIVKAIEAVYSGQVTCVLCEHSSDGTVEADRYYLQIFTRDNLKLVHIVCHYKGKHDAESGVYTLCKKCSAHSIENK
ncbi:DNA fragmentation factor subunit beta isoform X1 [Cydia pomonella]|uniref:DNA fragmentation factor subunit beta isoform X1 n=1 Tax=Cydia pomonella TaxID=82600 RepID=UPI002ADE5317|nr:DNA fragmentation factor subunit beta isoform X1 [Cydia pomonella]